MKFTVAVPLVALLTAYILALLTLLAGIKPTFMPDAYIVRIFEKDQNTTQDAGSNGTAHPDNGKEDRFPLLMAHIGGLRPALDIANNDSLRHNPGSDAMAGSTLPPISPTHTAAVIDTTWKCEFRFLNHSESSLRVHLEINYSESNNDAQGKSTAMKRVPDPADNDNVLIHDRSDPKNHTSDDTATDHLAYTFSLHFLTNCQWDLDKKANICSKPWDFGKYMFGSGLFEDDPLEDDPLGDDSLGESHPLRSYQSLLKRNYVKGNESEPDEEEPKEKWDKNIHHRKAFSKVHLTGCVLVGLSLLCTAISFFILPALGRWISVGNLVLATLATIFLLTSSIFTAVLVKKVQGEFGKGGHLSEESELYDIEPGKTLRALV